MNEPETHGVDRFVGELVDALVAVDAEVAAHPVPFQIVLLSDVHQDVPTDPDSLRAFLSAVFQPRLFQTPPIR